MCESTQQDAKTANRLDATLAVYRISHEAVARYTVFLRRTHPHNQDIDVQPGLCWEDGKTMMDRMNDERQQKSFGSPIYGIRLENQEEALRSVRAASKEFWGC